MAIKISKIFLFLLIIYMMWFQEVFSSIPYLSLILGFGLLLFIFIDFIKHKKLKDIKNYLPLELNLLIFFGLTSLFFGFLIAENQEFLINSINRYFNFIILLYAIFYLSMNDKKIDFFVYVYLLSVILSAITTSFWGYDYQHGRITMGPMNNPNSLGIVMVFGISFLLYKLKIKNIFSILITSSLTIYFAYIIILTGSRKAFISFLLVFVLWIILLLITQFRKMNLPKKLIFIFSVLSFSILFYYVIIPFIQDFVLWGRLENLLSQGDTTRINMYKEAWSYFKRSPLIGIGFNQFRVYSQYRTYSHTTYGEALACTGIIGAMIYFSTYLIIFIRYLRQVFNRNLPAIISHQYKILFSLFGVFIFLGAGVIHFYGRSSLLILGVFITFDHLHRHDNNNLKEYKGKIGVIMKIIDNPRSLIKILGDKKFFNWLPDKLYLKLVYWGETGKRLNLKNPKIYNEKLQWLKLNDRKREYIQYVDKLEVRKYIKSTIGEEYLVPIIAVYENIEDINWDSLPNKFVLKCTHGSKANIICRDKNQLDKKIAIKKLKRWMKKNWYWFGREWPYKFVKPRIIIEKYLTDNIIDYKFLCFNGVPKLIQIHQNRDTEKYTMDYYTPDWQKTNIYKKGVSIAEGYLKKPHNLNEMLDIAKKLSQNTYFARIDLYNVEGKIYFGEITLFPTSGFSPLAKEEDELLLGSWISLV